MIFSRLKLLDSVCGRWWGRVLLAFGVNGILFLCCYKMVPVFFMTNDDGGILYALGGYDYPVPMGEHPYTTPWFAWFVSKLFTLVPEINWYTLLHVLVLYLSCSTILAGVLDTSFYHRTSAWAVVGFYFMFFLLFCLIPVTNLSFTITPAMAGAAAVALLLTPANNRKREWILQAVVILLMLICITWRYSTGTALIPFYGLAQLGRAWKLLEIKNCKKMRTLLCGVLVVCILFFGSAVSRQIQMEYGNPELWEYNSAKAGLLDYPHRTYEEAEEIYQSLGIRESLFALMERRFSLDERLSAENYRYLADRTGISTDEDLEDRLIETVAQLDAFFLGNNLYIDSSVLLALLLVAGLVAAILSNDELNRRHLFMMGATLLGSTVLVVALAFMGRIIYRAYEVVAIPMMTTYLMLIGKQGQNLFRTDDLPKTSRLKIICGGILFAIVLTLGILGARVEFSPDTLEAKVAKVEGATALENYVLNHSESFYVYDYTAMDNINPFSLHTENKLDHLISWGANPGDLRAKRVAKLLGVERLTGEIFLNSNVFYVTYKYSSTRNTLEWYMEDYYDASGEVVDSIADGNIEVIQFHRVD